METRNKAGNTKTLYLLYLNNWAFIHSKTPVNSLKILYTRTTSGNKWQMAKEYRNAFIPHLMGKKKFQYQNKKTNKELNILTTT